MSSGVLAYRVYDALLLVCGHAICMPGFAVNIERVGKIDGSITIAHALSQVVSIIRINGAVE